MLNTRPFQEPPERGDLRETVEALLGRHLPADRALAVDRAGAFASAAWEALGQAGLLGLGGDEASGGSGGTVGDAVAVVEEIARVLPSLAVDYVVCGMAMRMLGDGAGAPVAGWMPAIASGAMVCAFGLSEPDVGTDLLSLRTSARVDGDRWVLKGQKLWISLAHEAEVAFVLCRTDPPEGDRKARGLSVIAVPLDQDGVTVRRVHLAGMRAAGTCEIFLDDAVAPLDNLVGVRGRAMSILGRTLDVERVLAAGLSLGIGRSALDLHVSAPEGAGGVRAADRRLPGAAARRRRLHRRPHGRAGAGRHGGPVHRGRRAVAGDVGHGQARRRRVDRADRRPGHAGDGGLWPGRGVGDADVLPGRAAAAVQSGEQRDDPQHPRRVHGPAEEVTDPTGDPVDITRENTALLVIDMQNGFIEAKGSMAAIGLPYQELRPSVAGCATLIEAAREAGVPVIYTRYVYHPDYTDAGLLPTVLVPAMKEVNSLAAGFLGRRDHRGAGPGSRGHRRRQGAAELVLRHPAGADSHLARHPVAGHGRGHHEHLRRDHGQGRRPARLLRARDPRRDRRVRPGPARARAHHHRLHLRLGELGGGGAARLGAGAGRRLSGSVRGPPLPDGPCTRARAARGDGPSCAGTGGTASRARVTGGWRPGGRSARGSPPVRPRRRRCSRRTWSPRARPGSRSRRPRCPRRR